MSYSKWVLGLLVGGAVLALSIPGSALAADLTVPILKAHALFHLPWLTTGGIDVKVGQYVTLEGTEVIYAPDNLLYSHSYIFNFGIPFKHTGIMTTTHVNPVLDVYAGIDT